MKIKKCPGCSGGKMHIPVPTTLGQLLGANRNDFWKITFLRCEKCGAIYWRTGWHYTVLYLASVTYFLFLGLALNILAGVMESESLGVICAMLGFLGYHYLIAVCTAHLPWKRVTIRPGCPPAQKRIYLATVQCAGIITGILVVLWVMSNSNI